MPARARDAKGRFVKKGGAKRVATNAAVPRKKRSWQAALKVWNKNRDEWTIPKKGTPEYKQVIALRG